MNLPLKLPPWVIQHKREILLGIAGAAALLIIVAAVLLALDSKTPDDPSTDDPASSETTPSTPPTSATDPTDPFPPTESDPHTDVTTAPINPDTPDDPDDPDEPDDPDGPDEPSPTDRPIEPVVLETYYAAYDDLWETLRDQSELTSSQIVQLSDAFTSLVQNISLHNEQLEEKHRAEGTLTESELREFAVNRTFSDLKITSLHLQYLSLCKSISGSSLWDRKPATFSDEQKSTIEDLRAQVETYEL